MIIEHKDNCQIGDYIGPITITNQAFAIAVSGTGFTGNVVLQIRPTLRDVEYDWNDEKSYSATAYDQSIVLVESWEVRAFVEDVLTGSPSVTLVASDGQP